MGFGMDRSPASLLGVDANNLAGLSPISAGEWPHSALSGHGWDFSLHMLSFEQAQNVITGRKIPSSYLPNHSSDKYIRDFFAARRYSNYRARGCVPEDCVSAFG